MIMNIKSHKLCEQCVQLLSRFSFGPSWGSLSSGGLHSAHDWSPWQRNTEKKTFRFYYDKKLDKLQNSQLTACSQLFTA